MPRLNLSNSDYKNFNKERKQALLSLDMATIKAFAQRWGEVLSYSSEEVFWAGIHKARTALIDFPPEAKLISHKWLIEHKYQSFYNPDQEKAP